MRHLLFALLSGLFFFTSCVSQSQYLVVLDNGQRIIAVRKPKLDKENLAFVFTDLKGRTNSIPSEQVRGIVPVSAPK
ncbi:MAG TPA: YgdI/YgdR family lipoprotein [Dongiaceae bacterium]|jgi:hypothetical protein|nr:YgdI/YgdR family lipoprotein [Dongiaceae bacterium]